MDGTNTKDYRINSVDAGTSGENAALLPIVFNAGANHPEDELPINKTSAEDGLGVYSEKRVQLSLIFRRGVCIALAILGVASYTILGYLGVKQLKNGGFSRLVCEWVFGGEVSLVKPEMIPQQNALPDPPDLDTNSANAENEVNISPEDIGSKDPQAVYNETGFDIGSLSIPASSVITEFSENSTVLIIHTHGTESYSPEEDTVSADENFRRDDIENNMIAVGKTFAEVLEQEGVKTIHCTEMFDLESYIDAYGRSAAAVKKYMKEYPDITCVVDIHRDAVIRGDGTVIKSDGDGMAQLMIVCGTSEMGADFPRWRENFIFGREYQKKLFEKNPRIVRHMNLRSASFNQQLCDRYLLLEVGTCGNTIDEAKESAKIAAEALADLLQGER